MTEENWLTSQYPWQMFFALRERHMRRMPDPVSVSDRKQRLFTCACCRQVWQAMDSRLRAVVETAERFADGEASEEELTAALETADRAVEAIEPISGTSSPANAARTAVWTVRREVDIAERASGPALSAEEALEREKKSPEEWERWGGEMRNEILAHAAKVNIVEFQSAVHYLFQEIFPNAKEPRFQTPLISGMVTDFHRRYARQTELLRCVYGNPFRPIALECAWLTSTVLSLAQQIYDSRDFSPMPILADALQDAGCENDEVLNHCRGEGVHVRGCWVLDRLLGKT